MTRAALTELPFTPRMGTFHPDYRLPVTQRATLTDYIDSGYDRGHMTPSGDAADPAEQQDTFLLSNVVPQTPALNRHAWEHIERQVREIAAHYGDAYVVTGPVFDNATVRTIGPDHIWVPDETWKAVYVPDVGAAVWLCTNTATPSCRTISVLALIARVGVDPFPGLGIMAKLSIAPLVTSRRHYLPPS